MAFFGFCILCRLSWILLRSFRLLDILVNLSTLLTFKNIYEMVFVVYTWCYKGEYSVTLLHNGIVVVDDEIPFYHSRWYNETEAEFDEGTCTNY